MIFLPKAFRLVIEVAIGGLSCTAVEASMADIARTGYYDVEYNRMLLARTHVLEATIVGQDVLCEDECDTELKGRSLSRVRVRCA